MHYDLNQSKLTLHLVVPVGEYKGPKDFLEKRFFIYPWEATEAAQDLNDDHWDLLDKLPHELGFGFDTVAVHSLAEAEQHGLKAEYFAAVAEAAEDDERIEVVGDKVVYDRTYPVPDVGWRDGTPKSWVFIPRFLGGENADVDPTHFAIYHAVIALEMLDAENKWSS